MPQLLLVNPRKGRMPPGLARYWAKRRGRRRNPRRRHARRVHAARGYTVGHKRIRRRKLNPRRRHRVHLHRRRHHYARRRRHRNPRDFSVRSVTGVLVPAAIGGVGAIGLDVAWGYGAQYLPAQVQTGWLAAAVKVAGAIGIGWGLRRFTPLRSEWVHAAVGGAVTVIAYQTLRDAAKNAFPDVKGLGGYADYIDYRVGAYMPGGAPGMGAYMPGGAPGMGFYNPAPLLDASGNQTMASLHGFAGADVSNDGM